ncbi:hypothetical protein [Microbispora sp. CA-102843]|uniref:hypothetical protein n=1 Tax=Microbispora sp. CA-102843 TaxID=3239952 RepID=UPI003D9459EB
MTGETVRKISFEWALEGKHPGSYDDYELLSWSEGRLTREVFDEVRDLYATGTASGLPQVTIARASTMESGRQSYYVVLAVQEWSPHHDGTNRKIAYTRWFYVPYEQLIDHRVSYEALYTALRALPETPAPPLTADVPALDLSAVSPGPDALSAAALLLTGRQVCVVGAEGVPMAERLRFLDTVAALLPYGMRARLTAATWTSSTANHKIKLFFARHAPSGAHAVPWERGADVGHEQARHYHETLRWAGDRLPEVIVRLAEQTGPLSFAPEYRTTVLELLEGAIRPLTEPSVDAPETGDATPPVPREQPAGTVAVPQDEPTRIDRDVSGHEERRGTVAAPRNEPGRADRNTGGHRHRGASWPATGDGTVTRPGVDPFTRIESRPESPVWHGHGAGGRGGLVMVVALVVLGMALSAFAVLLVAGFLRRDEGPAVPEVAAPLSSTVYIQTSPGQASRFVAEALAEVLRDAGDQPIFEWADPANPVRLRTEPTVTIAYDLDLLEFLTRGNFSVDGPDEIRNQLGAQLSGQGLALVAPLPWTTQDVLVYAPDLIKPDRLKASLEHPEQGDEILVRDTFGAGPREILHGRYPDLRLRSVPARELAQELQRKKARAAIVPGDTDLFGYEHSGLMADLLPRHSLVVLANSAVGPELMPTLTALTANLDAKRIEAGSRDPQEVAREFADRVAASLPGRDATSASEEEAEPAQDSFMLPLTILFFVIVAAAVVVVLCLIGWPAALARPGSPRNRKP